MTKKAVSFLPKTFNTTSGDILTFASCPHSFIILTSLVALARVPFTLVKLVDAELFRGVLAHDALYIW